MQSFEFLVCRACLASVDDANLSSLFYKNSETSKIFESISGVEVSLHFSFSDLSTLKPCDIDLQISSEKGKFPAMICVDCSVKLQEANELRQKIQNSENFYFKERRNKSSAKSPAEETATISRAVEVEQSRQKPEIQGNNEVQASRRESIETQRNMIEETIVLDTDSEAPPAKKSRRVEASSDNLLVEHAVLESELKAENYRLEDRQHEENQELWSKQREKSQNKVVEGEKETDTHHAFENDTIEDKNDTTGLNTTLIESSSGNLELKELQVVVKKIEGNEASKFFKPTSGKVLKRKRSSKTKCLICNKNLLRNNLTRHFQNVHERQGNFSCDLCDYESFVKNNFKKHISRHIKNPNFKSKPTRPVNSEMETNPAKSTAKCIKCDFPGCNKFFKWQSDLIRHQLVHLSKIFLKFCYF
jgi:Zinc-finger associated domain (zf-AD)